MILLINRIEDDNQRWIILTPADQHDLEYNEFILFPVKVMCRRDNFS